MLRLRIAQGLDVDLRPYDETWIGAVRALHLTSFTVLAGRLHSAAQISGHAALVGAPDYGADLKQSRVRLALLDDGLLVATAGWAPVDAGTARIRKLFVRPDLTRRGLGRAMLDAVEREAIASGRRRLTLRANPNAVPLYLQAGYVRVSEGVMPTPTGADLPVVYMERIAAA